MKRIKICSLITVALVSASMAAPYSSTIALASTNNAQIATTSSVTQSSGVTVDVTNSNNAASTNSLNPKFKITNTSSEAINLSDLNLKYYYNSDGSEKQNFYCDYSGTTSGTYKNFTGNVVGTFNPYTGDDSTGTNTYLQVGFNSSAGTLEPGQTMEVQTRIAKENWTNYDQSNDFSFNANGTSPWDKVTAEIGGTVVWGQGPKIIYDSEIDVKEALVKLAATEDIVENLTLNGNEFLGIKNGSSSLVKGTDYTIDGTKVTISKDYLKKLPEGTTSLVFDFNQGKDPVLVINAVGEHLDVAVGKAVGKAEETVTIPVKVSGIPADKGIYGYNFALSYDTTKFENVKVAPAENCPNPASTFKGSVDATTGIIKVSYMNSTMDDNPEETIFTDGVLVNVTFTIKKDAPRGKSPITVTNKGDFAYVQNVTDIGKYKVSYTAGEIEVQGEIKDSVINPTSATFQKETPKDINVGITNNGNTLLGIKDANGKTLTEGKEYTIVNGNVVFSKDYLSTLAVGQAVFTFDFSEGADPTLTIDVKQEQLDVAIGKVEGKRGDTVTVPVTLKGIPADKGVYGYNFSLNYDTTKFENVKVAPSENCPNPESTFRGSVDATTGTIKVSYMNSTMDDDASETLFTDGVIVNVTLTIKSSAALGTSAIKVTNKGDFAYVQNVTEIGKYKVNYTDGEVNIVDKVEDTLDVAIGKVDGKRGETITVPVTLNKIPENKGVYGYNFSLKYDTTKFENVKVAAGSNCPNPASTFRGSVDASTGIIKVSYMNSTMDDNPEETLFTNGVIVNVTLTIKSSAALGTSAITVSNKGDFAYVENVTEIGKYKVDYTDGQVNISDEVEDELYVAIGKVDAKQGETITVPVTLNKVPAAKGVYGYNFSLKYDTTKFENVKVSAGENSPSPASTFRGSVDATTGIIKASYMNSTMDDDPSETIFSDGVIVNVTLTVKSDAAVGVTPITVSTKGDFASVQNGTEISKYTVNYTDGSVNISKKPDVIVDSKLNKTSADFDLSKPADISVGVTYNGNTLSGIKDASGKSLVLGTDYTVSGSTVVLSKSYLSTLPVGAAVLTFDFNQGADLTLTVNVSKSVVILDSKLDKTSVDNNLSKPADISVGVTYNGNTLSAIKDASGKVLASGTDYTVSDNAIVLTKSYLSTLQVGATVLTFDFNQGAVSTLTINSVKDSVTETTKVTTDAVNVKVGDTFKVPILIKNAPTAGIAGMSVNVKYDSTVLTCTGFTYGGLITSPKTDFFGNNLTAKANVIMNYYDANKAGTAIKSDGVFAILTFKVNATAKTGATTITENKATVLSDASSKAYPVSVEFGKINVQ